MYEKICVKVFAVYDLCIFTAIDDRGHAICKYNGLGKSTITSFKTNIKADRFLLTVPEKEPFALFKGGKKNITTNVGDSSFAVSDKEFAIGGLFRSIGIPWESHVFRRKGKMVRLPVSAHNIQRVNNLHKRLKDFLRKTNHVSSKYLPGYLVFFEFLENTNASDKAIRRLFEIIATPGLGKPSDFYKEYYVVPNYFKKALERDNPLKQFSENQLRAVFLYSQRKKDLAKKIETISTQAIAEQTGYSKEYIRRLYKNFVVSGLLELVEKYYTEDKQKQTVTDRKTGIRMSKITPELLLIYDEYATFRKLPAWERSTIPEFFSKMNQKYNLNIAKYNYERYMRYIEELGLREPLPKNIIYPHVDFSKRNSQILSEYDKMRNSYLSKGQKAPGDRVIATLIAPQINFTPKTLFSLLNEAK